MSNMRSVPFLMLVLTLVPHTPRAQPAGPLTLDEAIASALRTSRRLAEARARGEGAEAAVRVRRAAALPTVVASAGYTRTNHVDEFGVPLPDGRLRVIYPDIPDNVLTRVGFAWPIYTAGRLDALERAAAAEAAAASADVESARADLRLEVVRAYWALATAEQAFQVLDEALRRADAHLGVVRTRLDTGLVPPNEVLSAEAQRSRQQMLLIEARNTRDAAAVVLKGLIGVPLDDSLMLADRLDPAAAVAAPLSGGEPAPVETALAARPERQALLRRLEGAEERLHAAAAGRRPTVALAGNVDYARPNPRIFPRQDLWRESWDLSVNVSWTLWDAGRTAAARAEAAAGVTATRARLAAFDDELARDIRLRRLDLDSAYAALAAAGDGVRAAAEAHRVLTERFAVGVAMSTDVLDAEGALLQAELDRTRAAADIRLAEARLARVLGR